MQNLVLCSPSYPHDMPSLCSTPLLRLTQVVHGYLDRAVPGLAPINRAVPGLGPINILALLATRPLLQGINTVTQARRTILDIWIYLA